MLISVRPVGMLEMVDQSEPDQKILAVPNRNPRFDQIHTIDQVFPHNLREIEHFFAIYKELEGKRTEMRGWRGPREARDLIRMSRQSYLDSQPQKPAKPARYHRVGRTGWTMDSSPAPSRRRIPSWLPQVLGYCLSAACLIWVLHGYSLRELTKAIGSLDWRWVLLSVVSRPVALCRARVAVEYAADARWRA